MYIKIFSVNSSVKAISRINSFCTSSKHLFKTYYDVLNIQRDCTTKEIKDAFIKLSKQYHPDITNNPTSQHKFVKIVEAYNVLSKPHLRRNYDLGLIRPIQNVDNNSPNPYYHEQRNERSTTRDPSFWEYRDKSRDKFYEERPYYGISGIKKVSNKVIVFVCLVFAAIGVSLQVILIRKSVTLKRDHMIMKSIEGQEALNNITQDALKYGNKIQLQRLRERMEENNLIERISNTPKDQ